MNLSVPSASPKIKSHFLALPTPTNNRGVEGARALPLASTNDETRDGTAPVAVPAVDVALVNNLHRDIIAVADPIGRTVLLHLQPSLHA